MEIPPLALSEANRLKALHSYNILDTFSEQAFDDLTALAAQICGTPIALISLVDANRQWVKSQVGLAARETSRELAFCAHAILQPNEVLIVPNALLDERFASNPLVTSDPNIQFYAGAPLVTPEGYPLGTICVIDYIPRELTPKQMEALLALSRQVMAQLELHRNLADVVYVNQELRQAQEALKQSEKQYRSVVNTVKEVIFQLDTTGNWIFLNPAWTEITGFSLAESIGTNFWQYVHKHDSQRYQELFEPLINRQKESCRHEVLYLTKDGGHRWIEVYARLTLDTNEQIVGISGTLNDITERKQTEERLRLLKSVVVNANDAVIITSAEPIEQPGPQIIYTNEAFSRMTGFSHEEVRGKTPRLLQGPKTDQANLGKIRSALKTWQPVVVELINYRKDGSEFWVELSIVPVADESGWYTHWVSVQRDITKRKQAEAALLRVAVAEATNQKLEKEIGERKRVESQLLHNSFHDLLTGLPNRALFLEQLRRALMRTKQNRDYRFALLFLDLERFKLINDSLGHMVGDELLISLAQRLLNCLGYNDTIARLGGDEFVVLLEDIQNLSDATHIAQRLQTSLALPFHLKAHEMFISASIGIVLSWGTHSETYSYERPEELLRDADIAMYRAKAQGKARYEVFDIAMHTQAVTRLQLENDLRRAIERLEFVLHYQPIVSLKTGLITGFEALIRWIHPLRGLISPDLFIPVAEETGLIVPIGQWVLYEACRQMSAWLAQFSTSLPLTISVNLSVKQFRQPNLIEQIVQILHRTKLDARSLKLEITESVLIENAEVVTPVLLHLKAMGVLLCLDDFGTGYSSLSYLHRFPIDVLKIDRSFVSHMSFGDENSKIVQAIITLAQALGINVVAEGIETIEQQAQLSRLQCQYGQGYLFSKPLDGKAAGALIRGESSYSAICH